MAEWDNLISDMREAAREADEDAKRRLLGMLSGWLEALGNLKEDGDDGRGSD